MPMTAKKTFNRSTHSVGVRKRVFCPLCREYPLLNKATLATLEDAAKERDLIRRTGKGRWKAYTVNDLDEMWKDLES